jgi:anti-sigma B factor antagonist
MSAAKLDLERETVRGREAVITRLSGMLSLETVHTFIETMRPEPAACLILDMSGVSYLDSAGVGALVSLFVSRRNREKKLVVAALTKQGTAVLQVAGLTKLLPIFSTVEQALATQP